MPPAVIPVTIQLTVFKNCHLSFISSRKKEINTIQRADERDIYVEELCNKYILDKAPRHSNVPKHDSLIADLN